MKDESAIWAAVSFALGAGVALLAVGVIYLALA